MRWTEDRVPDQTGRTAIVTGANAGLGYETALALGRKGARVVLACRSEDRGRLALDALRARVPEGRFELSLLDLSDLSSVRTFAERTLSDHDRLDLLINNAGVMIPPLTRTTDGFELQIGVNFLGHFALTGLLLDRIEATPGSRVVTLSSVAHRGARIDFDSFTGDRPYRPVRAYQQSKLACLMHALELHERLRARGSRVRSLGAHPGGTRTELQRHNRAVHALTRVLAMDGAQGALPTLFAATEPSARGGDYIGPSGLFEMRGYPTRAKIDARARDAGVRARLWDEAETLTGVSYLT